MLYPQNHVFAENASRWNLKEDTKKITKMTVKKAE
jgi:hypothetical protein